MRACKGEFEGASAYECASACICEIVNLTLLTLDVVPISDAPILTSLSVTSTGSAPSEPEGEPEDISTLNEVTLHENTD